MTHYQAVLQAYYLGYNNVLIFEDDVCMYEYKYVIIKRYAKQYT